MTRSFIAQAFDQAKTLVDKGDVAAFRRLLEQYPALAYPHCVDGKPPGPDNALLLHLVNWPGGKPNGAGIAAVLLEAGADPNLRVNDNGESVLHWAVSNDKDAAIVTTLLDGGADWSCLHHAAYCGSLDMARYLVARGADLEVRESNHATPANYAAAHGHPDVMHYLIDAGTRITLEQAAGCGRLDRVRDGIEQCTDASLLLACTIGTTTDIGKPIHPSIIQGRLDVARFLLDRDPALRRATVNGVSVVEIARHKKDQQMLSLLQDDS